MTTDLRLEIIAAYREPSEERIAGLMQKHHMTREQVIETCRGNAESMQKAVDGVPGYGGNPEHPIFSEPDVWDSFIR